MCMPCSRPTARSSHPSPSRPGCTPHSPLPRPGAALFERAVADLWGHQAADAHRRRPWLDHGVWPHAAPALRPPGPQRRRTPGRARARPAGDAATRPASRSRRAARRPCAAPAYWRATLDAGNVTELEARLGWAPPRRAGPDARQVAGRRRPPGRPHRRRRHRRPCHRLCPRDRGRARRRPAPGRPWASAA